MAGDTAKRPTEAGRRVHGLDALRGIAALMIFVQHVHLPGPYPAPVGLHTGVLIFFALSGFLLYEPFTRGPVNLRTYAVRRFLRIMPAYLVAAFAIAALWHPELLRDPVGLVTMQGSSIAVVWTLRLEIAFYILLPFAAWGLTKLPPERRAFALFIGAGASILSTVGIMVIVPRIGTLTSDSVGSIVSYAWAFVPGMIVAQVRPHVGPRIMLGGVGLLLLSTIANIDDNLAIPAGVGAGMVIAYLHDRPIRRFVPLASGLGAVSFSVYLWHMAIIEAFDRPDFSWTGAVLAFGLTLTVAGLVYVLIERPAIRLGRLRRAPLLDGRQRDERHVHRRNGLDRALPGPSLAMLLGRLVGRVPPG